MKKVIIIRYSEIYLKGKNRGFFERAFETNLRRAVKDLNCELIKQSGRYLVQDFQEEETDEIVAKLCEAAEIDDLFAATATVSGEGDARLQVRFGPFDAKYDTAQVKLNQYLLYLKKDK